MRGRKATPTAIKVATGNPGRRPLPKHEPKPIRGMPDAPAWMSDSQRAIWEYAVEQAPAGVLSSMDWTVFTVYVVAAAAHQDAALKCAELGTVITTTNGNEVQAPWVGMLNRQALILLRACSELGFTPASRSKVVVMDDGDGEEEDPAARYFQ